MYFVKCIGSRLTLRRAQKKHAGIYQCFATNSVGTVYGSTMLQVSPKQITTNINADRNVYEQREGNFFHLFTVTMSKDKLKKTEFHSLILYKYLVKIFTFIELHT